MSFRKLLSIIGLNFLVFGVLLHILTTWLYLHGALPEYSRGTVVRCLADLFRKHWSDDSWGPMIAALRNFHATQVSIYQSTFFDLPHWMRFQYPLPALLPLWVLQRFGLSEAATHGIMDGLSWCAVWGTAGYAVAIALRTARYFSAESSRMQLIAIALITSLTFYPVMWAYDIGQIQVFVNLLFCAAFYYWLVGREGIAGVFLGTLVLMKPQFLIVLAWGLLRRRWTFSLAGAAVVVAGFLASIGIFGLANHFDYLRVLSFLARHGESYYPNQSFNGVLNRLVLNWPSVTLIKDSYPPYRPLIYIVTTITSAMLVIWAMGWRFRLSHEARMMDFSLVSIAATAASPITWYHHYGILLPVLVWLFAQFPEEGRWKRSDLYLIVAAYCLVASDTRIMNLSGDRPIINLAQSSFFFGVLLLIWYLGRQVRVAAFACSRGLIAFDRLAQGAAKPIKRDGFPMTARGAARLSGSKSPVNSSRL